SGLGLDISTLVVGGDSAGGNLTVGTALALRDAGEPLIKGMVLNYGCYDVDFLADSVMRFGGGDYLLTTHMMVWFFRQYMRT
ncbi:alpha/beta hydrolase fold domain-containing protein, partial [Acinetobacter baumannii]